MKLDVKYRNSAGRLLVLLTDMPAACQGKEMVHGLPQFFEIKGFDPRNTSHDRVPMAYEGLRELQMVYMQFKADMEAVDINEDQRKVLLSGLKGLEETIYPMQLNGGFRTLGAAEKSLLEVCATVLNREDGLTTATLDEIKKSVSELESVIRDSATPDELKKVLLDLIRLSREALDRYSIHGAAGLRKAFKQMLGEVAELHFTLSEEQEVKVKTSGAWQMMLSHLNKFNTLIGVVDKSAPLLKKAKDGLLSLM
jgi:hypothetical protein